MAKWRIMVVDDDEDTRRLISLALRPRYEVVEAGDGLEALTRLETYEPDFIILDIVMPLLDGYSTCESIRQKPEYRDIPVLFLSSKSDTEDIKKGYKSGADLFLTKPIEPQRLLRNVDMVFESKPPPLKLKKLSVDQIKEREKTFEAPETPKQVKARVLVVDDDPDIISFVNLALKNKYEMVSATDSMAAINKIANYEPDIILLDIMMPKLSGYQLCQSVRRNAKFHDTPIVFMSAKSTAKDIQYARQLGANDYLVKPFGADVLQSSLQKVVQSADFEIRPKRFSYQEIMKIEEKEREAREITATRIVEGEDKKYLKKQDRELKRFINKHMQDKKL